MTLQPPDRTLAGIADLGISEVEQTPQLERRREAVADLGDALRQLINAAVSSEVSVQTLRTSADEARRLTQNLAATVRSPGHPASVDDLRRGQRPFNPVVGAGNPVAPPMHIRLEGDVALGTCTLGLAYEGPMTFAHGGISALLLDQIMGYATAAAGYPGVTGRLHVRYLSAVPLGAPLALRAEVIDVLGIRVAVRGTISLATQPETSLVQADGRFLMLSPEQARRLFRPAGAGAP
jgi:hypothetical protein